jgi:hypothetical protein
MQQRERGIGEEIERRGLQRHRNSSSDDSGSGRSTGFDSGGLVAHKWGKKRGIKEGSRGLNRSKWGNFLLPKSTGIYVGRNSLRGGNGGYFLS